MNLIFIDYSFYFDSNRPQVNPLLLNLLTVVTVLVTLAVLALIALPYVFKLYDRMLTPKKDAFTKEFERIKNEVRVAATRADLEWFESEARDFEETYRGQARTDGKFVELLVEIQARYNVLSVNNLQKVKS